MSFLFFLLKGLPLIGKLSDMFTNYTNKRMDTDLEKYRVKGSVDTEAMKQDTEIIKARTELAIIMKDDPANRWGRRLLMYPTGVYYCLIIWDSSMRSLIPDYTWRILELPQNVQYIPYAVVAYLLVTAWKK